MSIDDKAAPRRPWVAAAAVALALLAPAGATAQQPGPRAEARPASGAIRGRIRLEAGRRQVVAPEEVAQTVLYFLPDAGAARPATKQLSSTTYTKGFEPNLLVATVGSTVSFPNRDVIIHNVFSATPGSSFDLGSYGPGQTRSQRFERPGLVVVNCNVHRGMRANVLVLETPHSTQARPDGSFALTGLPAAPGTLVIWHPRAAAQSIAWNGRAALTVERTLVATRPRIGGGS